MPFYLYEIAPKGHAVIIDLKPDAPTNVSLYRIEDVWGVSNPDWTPLALRLRPLFVDLESRNPALFKKRFRMPSDEDIKKYGGPIHEFLYATHGMGIEATWKWGRSGVVNATLLWPEVLEYFFSSIRERMRDDDAKPSVEGETCIRPSRISLLSVLKNFAIEQVARGRRKWHAREEDILCGMGVVA